jgi:nucleotide-binding universal stress UspA family protein
MYPTALVALDLSPAEGPMLDCLGDLRDLGVTRAILAHVIRVGYAQGAGFGHEADYRDWLEGRAAPLRAAGLDVAIDIRAAGQPAEEILAAAAGHSADLVVIGSRGQSMLRGLFLGSTAREVIRRADRPVRLEWIDATAEGTAEACARACTGRLERLLLATDFSPAAGPAEAAAVALASGRRVDLVHVLTEADRSRLPRWSAMARGALDAIAAEVAAAGGTAAVHLTDGTPSDEIARAAAAGDAQLVVVGRHGQGRLRSALIGSTAARLCEIARRPVLMIPPQDR